MSFLTLLIAHDVHSNALLHMTDIMYLVWQLYLAWQGSDQDTLFNSKGQQAISDIKAASVSNHTDNPFIYLNYADRSQSPLEGYGDANVAKIKAAAAKYDPTGVFQTLMPGGFKISLVDSDSNTTCAAQNGSSGTGQGASSGAVGLFPGSMCARLVYLVMGFVVFYVHI